MENTTNSNSEVSINNKDRSKLPLLITTIISISTLVIIIFFSFLPNLVKMPLTKYKLVFAVIVEKFQDVENVQYNYVYSLNKVRISKNQYKIKISNQRGEDINTVRQFFSTTRKYYMYDFKLGNMKEINLDDALSMAYYMNQNFGFTHNVSALCDDSPDGYKLESVGNYDFPDYKVKPELMDYQDEDKGLYIKNFFVRHKFYDGYMSECFGWTL
ncbi:MAG: hypothetical protein N3A71_01110 [Candidatus Dojkabacteria bacterium]|nr:hypothetical protein [Candidatus Dojkabacteria bacterium]